ncbi:hypothetical protein FJ250_09150 [bacterium]|nr:hypothetical protein [bacterium]
MTTNERQRRAAVPARELERLAALLDYPAAGLDGAAAGCAAATALLALPPAAREECYTATFDLMAACTPYASVHLFGEESFKRAALMSALNARAADAGLPPSGELPDHVARLLALAARLDEAECRELAAHCLLGPVRAMADALDRANPYRAILEAALATLRETFPGLEAVPVARLRSEAAPSAFTTVDGCGGCAASAGCLEDEA